MDDSILAIIKACFFYIINDLRTKKRQFAIGMCTIFLTVSVVTFLDCLVSLAPAVTMTASQQTVGDFDLQFTKRDMKEGYRWRATENLYQDGFL